MSLIALTDHKLTDLWHWTLKGLSETMPSFLKIRFYKPCFQYYLVTNSQSTEYIGLLDRSWLGVTRTRKQADPQNSLPKFIELSSPHVFHTSFTLPASIGSDLEDAIELKMKSICPIPPENAVYIHQINEVKKKDGRLSIDVWIAKRDALSTIAAGSQINDKEEKSLPPIFGVFDNQNNIISFPRETELKQSKEYKAVNLLLAIMFVFIFLSGLATFSDRQAIQLQETQQQFLAATRSAQEKEERYDRLIAILPTLPEEKLSVAVTKIDHLLISLPSESVLKNIAIKDKQVTLVGFAPEQSISPVESSFNTAQISPSDYADWISFKLNQPIDKELR